MTHNKKISFTILLSVFVLYSCNYKDRPLENDLTEKKLVPTKDTVLFGNKPDDIKRVIEINIQDFSSYEQLVDRIEQVVCNDSVPAFKIESDSTYKTIYTINPCWDLYACILIYQRNVMMIINDSIITYFNSIKPIDSLATLLKAQIQNFGKSEYHAERLDKLIFTIEQDSLDAKRLTRILDDLTSIYLNETNRTDIHIRLDKRIEPPDFLLDSIEEEKNTP